jgi:MSHA biogenesis protein MshK
MADDIIRRQRTEDGRQKSCAASPRLFVRATVFCLLSSVFCPLIAEELLDPTRPPASLAAPGAAPGQLATVSLSSGLQTTIISKLRRAAIIDGKTVELGEMHGKDRLVEVNEGSVVLQGENTRRVLTLFPDVKMTPREINTKTLSPDSGLRPKKFSTKPVVQGKKVLSGHPKEEK